jgi:Leucine-rich repeat (LRR) protein
MMKHEKFGLDGQTDIRKSTAASFMADPEDVAVEDAEAAQEEQPELLTQELISSGLKCLAKTVDGTGFALTHLELPDKKIGDLEPLNGYKHIRYLRMPGNMVTDLKPLSSMEHLLSLDMSRNLLVNVELPALAFLQILNLSGNKLKAVQGMSMPMLKHLDISNNEIETIGGLEGNTALEYLGLHNNQLTSCDGLGLPSLKNITLTDNQITNVAGLTNLVNVAELDLSRNQVADLGGLPSSGKLAKLILQQNQIAEYEQIDSLTPIALTEMLLTDNPIFDNGFDRIKVVRRVPALEMLNNSPVTAEEKKAAEEPEVPPEPAAA